MPEQRSLTQEEIAQTTYRAWAHAWGAPVPPWETLSLEAQSTFLRLAKHAESAMTRLEGEGYTRVTDELMRLAHGEMEPSRSPRDLIAWEAVARHLATLLDSDEVEGPEALGDLEASWAPWAARRRETLIERTEVNL